MYFFYVFFPINSVSIYNFRNQLNGLWFLHIFPSAKIDVKMLMEKVIQLILNFVFDVVMYEDTSPTLVL